MENKYMGYSSEELKQRENLLNQQISHFVREIENEKQKIKEIKAQMKAYQSELDLVKEAKESTDKVELEFIIEVTKTTKREYIGKIPVSYYSPSNFKDYVVYQYSILKANAQDRQKFRIRIEKSGGYKFNEKKELNLAIMQDVKRYNVKKIYVADGVKIATKEIEKLGCKICEMSKNERL